jgi:hypothetical protein
MVTAASGTNEPASSTKVLGGMCAPQTSRRTACKKGMARQSGRNWSQRTRWARSVSPAASTAGARSHTDRHWMVQAGSPESGRAVAPNRIGSKPKAKIQSPVRTPLARSSRPGCTS